MHNLESMTHQKQIHSISLNVLKSELSSILPLSMTSVFLSTEGNKVLFFYTFYNPRTVYLSYCSEYLSSTVCSSFLWLLALIVNSTHLRVIWEECFNRRTAPIGLAYGFCMLIDPVGPSMQLIHCQVLDGNRKLGTKSYSEQSGSIPP